MFGWEKHGNSSDELRIGRALKGEGIAYHRDEMTSPGMARVSNDLKPLWNGVDQLRGAAEMNSDEKRSREPPRNGTAKTRFELLSRGIA